MSDKDRDTPTVFISSTNNDLEDFRKEVAMAAHPAKFHADLQENWTAEDRPPLDACLERVRKADALVVIVAHRYGWVPEDPKHNPGGKSITWLECEEAVANGKHLLAFVVDEGAEWPAELKDDADLKHAIEEGDYAKATELMKETELRINQLKAFKSWINSRGLRRTFKTKNELKLEVERALKEWHPKAITPRSVPTDTSRSLEIPAGYQEWLERECADLTFATSLKIQQGQALRLTHLYVPATISGQEREPERGRGPEDFEFVRPGAEEERPRLLLERLGRDSLYVAGDPGSGKSVFCRWAALSTVLGKVPDLPVEAPAGYSETLPDVLLGRLPLLLRLRALWEQLPPQPGHGELSQAQLEQAIDAWLTKHHPGGLDGQTARAYLAQGRALLILDGVDEVPRAHGEGTMAWHPRALLLSGLAAALPIWCKAGNRVLVTSRPYGLDDSELRRLGLEQAWLAPLNDKLQSLFACRWFTALEGAKVGDGKAKELIDHIAARRDIAHLLENPMLLTAVCVLFGHGGRLPEDKFELYDRIVDYVLYNRYPESAGDRRRVRERLGFIAAGMHTGEPLGETRETPEPEASHAQLEQLLRAFGQASPSTEKGVLEVADRLDELLSESGLLLPREGKRGGFYHLSFQEFLAAERLAVLAADQGAEAWYTLFLRRAPSAEWRYTLDFLFGAYLFRHASTQAGICLLGRLIDTIRPDALAVDANLAWALADCLDIALAKGCELPEEKLARFRLLCLAAIEQEIPLQPRQALGLILGRIDDPRILDPMDPAGYVQIPPERYPFQDDWIEIEEAYWLARYPVTNGQFKKFIEDGGYLNKEHWSPEGWEWLQKDPVSEPRFFHDHRYDAPNQPVVGVSWWEAEAFCRWAGGRLPSEQEWESAARGREAREYPWDGPWEDGICNTRESRLGTTSPVGLFPRSRQADFNLEDMAGNVWEWVSDNG
ncbi:MAG: SUMF1/EgtB/PvdO family nonheme iron enzyme, partial [bacterium]|nr:SUMF1/EgtB/PvdO family nonheme iron enzyme [bacterium]